MRILIAEDDMVSRTLLVATLKRLGHEVVACADGDEAVGVLEGENPPRIAVLDWMMPGRDGIEICRTIRGTPRLETMFVVLLTAKDRKEDVVAGLAAGADDYVTKPFSISVLLQRIKALLRRRDQGDGDRDVSSSRGIIVDRRRHRATAGGCVLDLTPSEFKLLDVLLRQPGRAYSRNELIDAALGNDAIVLARTIDVHVRALRRKLGKYADLVETVRGIGYRFRDPGAG